MAPAQIGVGVLAALLLGCPGSSNCPPQSDATSTRVVQVKGRVVDFETCLTVAGCQGIAGVRVALFYNNTVFSDPTQQSGAFNLERVPDGARHLLLVTDNTGQVVPSLQASPVDTRGSDVFGIELYAIKRTSGLYAGIVSEAGVDFQTGAIYLGQVLSIQNSKMKAIPDVAMHSSPAADIRYVNCIPTFSQCSGQPTLFQNRSSTGVFGEFVVISKSGAKEHVIWGESSQQSFAASTVPLGVGYVTIGLHQAAGATGLADGGQGADAGTTEAGP